MSDKIDDIDQYVKQTLLELTHPPPHAVGNIVWVLADLIIVLADKGIISHGEVVRIVGDT